MFLGLNNSLAPWVNNWLSSLCVVSNTHTLLIQIYSSLDHIGPPIMQESFDLKMIPFSL